MARYDDEPPSPTWVTKPLAWLACLASVVVPIAIQSSLNQMPVDAVLILLGLTSMQTSFRRWC